MTVSWWQVVLRVESDRERLNSVLLTVKKKKKNQSHNKYIDGATCCRPSMVVQATKKKLYIMAISLHGRPPAN